jgi:hypothetical protein
MSMILGLSTAADATIDKLLETPALVWRILTPDDPGVTARSAERNQGFFARLFRKKETYPVAPQAPDLQLADGERNEADLDKAWHGIHYLLTGSDWGGDPPLNFLVAGGLPVGDVDVGYGPARVFRSSEVARIRDALCAIQPDDLRRRYNPGVMMEQDIYPSIWDRDPKDDDALGYLLEHFAVLQRFVSDAASKGLGIVITLT